MAPKDIQTPTPKVQRSKGKNNLQKAKPSPSVGVKKTVRKTISMKTSDKIPLKLNSTTVEQRHRTTTAQSVGTPIKKGNKLTPLPGSVIKSVKKSSWKRRPKPAHSGVPVPEKMKKLGNKLFKDLDCSL